jgi:hypothetical protein
VEVILYTISAGSFMACTAISVRLPLNKLPKSKLYKLLCMTCAVGMLVLAVYTSLQPLSRVPLNSRSKYFGISTLHVRFSGTVFITKGFRAILTTQHHTPVGHGLFLLVFASCCLLAFRIEALASIGIDWHQTQTSRYLGQDVLEHLHRTLHATILIAMHNCFVFSLFH